MTGMLHLAKLVISGCDSSIDGSFDLGRAVTPRCQCWAVLLLVLSAVLCQQALAQDSGRPRLAVVVSNADYSQMGRLRNPTADGQLVASSLRAAGFSVTHLRNLNDQEFRVALRQVARDSAKADVTLFYFAGHGVQIGGTNYLLPVDVPLPESEDDVRLASVSADDVLSVIKSAYKIVVLDACRDNPVLGRALSTGRGSSYKRGLSVVAPPSESKGGVFIAYSTQTDAVAVDGEGANSPFAESFARHVGTNASIDDMFAMVTRDVLQKTNGVQRPFKYASLDTIFCLTGDCSRPVSPGAVASIAPTTIASVPLGSVKELFTRLNAEKSERDRKQIEQQLWERLRSALPKRVPHGYYKDEGGNLEIYGYEPASVSSDGRTASVTVRKGVLNGASVSFDESDSTTYSIDCVRHELAPTKRIFIGGVKLFSQAEQQEKLIKVQKGSIYESLERAVCSTMFRVSPMWAIDEIEWAEIGPGIFNATNFYYQDPVTPDVKYVLSRREAAPDPLLGNSLLYSWLGVNCRTNEFVADGYYSATRGGVVVAAIANAGKWAPPNIDSPAANTIVLVCERAK